MQDVVANSFAGLSFSGLTLLAALTVAGVVWCLVPFTILAMQRRLQALERAVEEGLAVQANDLRRVTDILLMESMRQGALPAVATFAQASDAPLAKFVPPHIIHGGIAHNDAGRAMSRAG